MEVSCLNPPVPGERLSQPTKPKRSTKKSVAAENEKRQRILDILLHCPLLPKYVEEVLKEEEKERGHLYKVSAEDVDQLLKELHDFVVDVSKAVEDHDMDLCDVIVAVVMLLQHLAVFHDLVRNETFSEVVVALNTLLVVQDNSPEELRNKVCELSEYCCVSEMNLPGHFYLNTFNYLFDLSLQEKNGVDMKPVIKRVWEMHVPLTRVNLRSQACEGVVSKLARVVVSAAYLSCREGRQFIAFTFTLDTKLIKKFHQSVKDFLPSCKRNQAVAYGEVYHSAWINGSTEVRQILETHCIQNFMTHMFSFPRKKQELSHLGQNVFALLAHLHSSRTVPNFSKTLTNLYMPLIWRHLRSGNNIERCNAAEVFLDAYPLEKPGSGKAEEFEFFEKQHGEMVELLTDNCHVVRIIAIKGICKRLCSAWVTFTQESIQVLMRNMVALANDGSQATVRRTLYDSLCYLLHNPESAEYLARVLPSISDYIHDENEKVRRSFVKLLCAIKAMPDPAPIKFWKVVTINHLAARLELENKEVGTVLSNLLMSHIYSPDVGVDKFLARVIAFINTNPTAARRLFQYSTKSLDFKNAVRVMLTILINLQAFVVTKEKSGQECDEEKKDEVETAPRRIRKKRRSREPLQLIQENVQENSENIAEDGEGTPNSSGSSNRLSVSSEENKSVQEREVDVYDKPGVAHALIDIVSLLWSKHSTSLMDPEHEADHNKLLDTACRSIPSFLKYFKGTPTYFAVIHLSSLVPANKLQPVSTVCSACISHLKSISEMTPQPEVHVIIFSLCAWNRFSDIQDVVVDWLDQGFRCEGLNQSQALTNNYKQRKVRFLAKGGKPMLALRLLDAVFGHPLNSRRVLAKSYNQVHELYVYLERIKVVVERRLLSGLPLESPMLSDEFILKCLYRYAKLIVILHRPEPQIAKDNVSTIEPFDASDVFRQFMLWSLGIIIPMIPDKLEDEPEISVLLMKDILRAATNLVDLNYARMDTLISLAELINNLLTSDCSLWFVEASLMVVKHIKDHSEAMFGVEDEPKLMSMVVPSLVSKALRSLSVHKYTKEEIAGCIQNLYEVKKVLLEVLQSIHRMFGSDSALLKNLLKLFTDCLVAIMVHDVKQLQLLDTVEKVQELPYVCGVLLSVINRPVIGPLWLSTMPSSIDQLYSKDSTHLAAAVSLLYTLVHSELSLPVPELIAAIKEAYNAVNSYTRDSTHATGDSSTVSDFSVDSIDIKKQPQSYKVFLEGLRPCASQAHPFMDLSSLKVSHYNRTSVTLDGTAQMFEGVGENVYMRMVGYRRSMMGGWSYIKMMDEDTFKACDFIDKDTRFWPGLVQNSNLPAKCPIPKANYTFTNGWVTMNNPPPWMPMGCYKITVVVWDDNLKSCNEIMVKVANGGEGANPRCS